MPHPWMSCTDETFGKGKVLRVCAVATGAGLVDRVGYDGWLRRFPVDVQEGGSGGGEEDRELEGGGAAENDPRAPNAASSDAPSIALTGIVA